MKFRKCSLLLFVLLLAGCASPAGQLNAAVDSAGRMIQTIGNAAESASDSQSPESTAGSLTGEEARNIALEHAGFTADQVSRLRTEYEVDDGVPRYEVTFRQGRWEYDYEIHAQTGTILSWDRDD